MNATVHAPTLLSRDMRSIAHSEKWLYVKRINDDHPTGVALGGVK